MRLFSFFSMLRTCLGLRRMWMRLFSFFATPCACAIAADGLGRTHIVRDPGIGIDFCPPRCGAKDGSRNAAALSEGAVFSLAGLALRMRRTVQDEDTTIQFFHDAPHLRHRGGLNWLGRCTLCDALESRLVSFRGAAALKMGAETLPHFQKSVFLALQVMPHICAGLRRTRTQLFSFSTMPCACAIVAA